ncbi:MAG: 4-hydroxy-tetrahydrodipicolinate reductase [Bacteroidales bacterium]|nr:4-hydroxy-tetrahydrodipicolinate reductase [Candidatus Liminaster caballi]
MKIALIGYGKMGHIIEDVALSRGHEVVCKIDVNNLEDFDSEAFRQADVAIEFTTPKTTRANMTRCLAAGVPVVVGSTGWYDQLSEVKAEVEKANGSLFWASNFSIGVNVFVAMQKYVARIMNGYPQYDVRLEETHHIHKLDSPSGTAITIANAVTDNLDRKQTWKETACVWQHEDESIDVARNAEAGTQFASHNDDELEVVAYRRGEVPGIHTVTYDSEVDTLTMTHSAKSRRGFALGAVVAAEWMGDGKKGVYTMTDLMPF